LPHGNSRNYHFVAPPAFKSQLPLLLPKSKDGGVSPPTLTHPGRCASAGLSWPSTARLWNRLPTSPLGGLGSLAKFRRGGFEFLPTTQRSSQPASSERLDRAAGAVSPSSSPPASPRACRRRRRCRRARGCLLLSMCVRACVLLALAALCFPCACVRACVRAFALAALCFPCVSVRACVPCLSLPSACLLGVRACVFLALHGARPNPLTLLFWPLLLPARA
jgi:hypothetical protein